MNGPCWTLGGVAAAMFTDSAVASRQISQNENVKNDKKKTCIKSIFRLPLGPAEKQRCYVSSRRVSSFCNDSDSNYEQTRSVTVGVSAPLIQSER